MYIYTVYIYILYIQYIYIYILYIQYIYIYKYTVYIYIYCVYIYILCIYIYIYTVHIYILYIYILYIYTVYIYILCIYIYCVYIYMIPSSAREVPPPEWDGSPDSTPPFPSICKLLAAFLKSSLLFARFLQRFWLPASHLLGTCYLLDDLHSTHTPSKYLRATYSHIYMCYVSTSYVYTYIYTSYRYIHTLHYITLH